MNYIYRFVFLILIFSTFYFTANSQDIRINELMSSNRDVIFDEDGDSPDWIEIINSSNETINLGEYFLSDDKANLEKWQFPALNLVSNQTLFVFASGKDRTIIPLFWYTLIDKGDEWNYIIPNVEPPSNWKTTEFNANIWESGATGIGYGDNDDETEIPKNTLSVFMRKMISIDNIDSLNSMWLHLDFDDAFVAYLNGTEIARQGIGQVGEPVSFDKAADVSHEAKIIFGDMPEKYNISEFTHLLVEGENTLAVQVHNFSRNSSDLSAIPIFTVGYSNVMEIDKTVSDYVHLANEFSHTNFKLSSSGETVLLSHSLKGVVDSITYGIISGDYSFGRDTSNPDNWGIFSEPTPGEKNQPPFYIDIITSTVQFSINEMFLNGVKYLVLTGLEDGEEIRYTLDNTEPTKNSSRYSSPIQINKNTVVRARIFKTGYVPGKLASRTFLFDTPPTLPVVSVTTDPVNLWDNETGIYVLGDSYESQMPHYGANYWEDWEKPASIEMTESDGERLFSMNCGIKIFGGWSRTQDQKSLSIFFRNEYGDPELNNIQLFDSKLITNFKSLVLRNSGNDYSYSKMRDGMMTSLVRNLDVDISAFRPTILYLNGEYWGIINLREKLNEDYLESNHDIKADKIDLLEGNGSVIEGSNESYLSLISFLEQNNLSDNSNYEQVTKQIDISNFIDYQLSQIYFDNRDWPGNNIKYWKSQTEDSKWRWIMYDTDFGFGLYGPNDYNRNTLEYATATNGPNWPNPPWSTFVFRKLLQNQAFKYRFINRYADVLNSTFLPGNVIALIDSFAEVIEPEMQRNYARWYSPDISNWNQNIETMVRFASNRPGYERKYIRQEFSTPSNHEINISILPASNGIVELNSLTITKPEWKGQYFKNVPISLTANALAGYKFKIWMVDGVSISDKTITLNIGKTTQIKALFEDAEDDGNSIVFNEINYNSPENYNTGDWVEIYNWGRFDLDISGWVFKDDDNEHEFVIPENTTIKSNEYLVLCKDEEKFNEVHPDITNYIGEFDFGLSSSGDALRLFDNLEQLVDEVVFGAVSPWPEKPNGSGPTLELRQYFYDNNVAESWKSSLVNLGTPGAVNSITTSFEWIAENIQKKELKVYPNPFTTETRITIEDNSFDPIQIKIYSLDGRVVCNEYSRSNEFIWKGENSSGQKVQPGIYICKVQSGSEIFTSKIILNK